MDAISGGRRLVMVNAPAELVWSLVTSVDRYGEWSPETYGAVWITDPPVGTGSLLRGYNRNRDGSKSWWSDCEVIEYDPPNVFSFRVLRADFGDGAIEFPPSFRTTWRYEISGGTDNCALTVAFDCPALADPESGYSKNNRFEAVDTGAEQTLNRIKQAAEGP